MVVIGYIYHYSLYIYFVVELTCTLLYIRSYLHFTIAKMALIICILLFTLYTILYLCFHPSDYYVHLSSIEGFMIIIPALYFFYESFTLSPEKSLSVTPAFWSISGMLALFTIITPIFQLINYLNLNAIPLFFTLITINNIAYSLLFTLFGMAIVYDKKLPKEKRIIATNSLT